MKVARWAASWLGAALAVAGATELPERVTFSRDIAPVLNAHCTQCHVAGGPAPFALTKYSEVKTRTRQVLEVVQQRLMPPWLPALGYGHFDKEAELRLTDHEIALLARWAAQGAVEGDRAHLPPATSRPKEWHLGAPDFIAEMPEAYTLPSEGRDVYRNFVLPVKLPEGRWVRAVEIQPGHPATVHHALLYLDLEGSAQRNEARARAARPTDGPGTSGMNPGPGISGPPGCFVSWQPGRRPRPEPEGIAWRLEKDTNLVLQLHLRPSGKPERIRARVGLYFSDQAPTEHPFTMLLRSTSMDIPPGEANYVIESSYRTPVALRVRSLLPHAHYLCREMKAWVETPGGTELPLFHIPRWNFDWQSDYRFVEPVAVPAGSTLRMRYVCDNSSTNPRNPSKPPQRRQFGLETTDVMAELWLQVVALHPAEHTQLVTDFQRNYAMPDTLGLATNLLKRSPDDPRLLEQRGRALAVTGRTTEAIAEVRRAMEIDPGFAPAHATLGRLYLATNQGILAESRFEKAVELDPSDYRSLNALGWMRLQQNDLKKARAYLEQALQLRPDDPVIRSNMEKARGATPLTLPRP